jgi:RimJ/RimL family protein N-acetyltransferase
VALAGPEGASADADAVCIGRLEAALHTPRAPDALKGSEAAVGMWGEVAYLFGRAYRGPGYAAEAMAWCHGALAARGARTLWAAVAPANARSAALLARLGYAEVAAGAAPRLGSYDPGDRCCRRALGVPA